MRDVLLPAAPLGGLAYLIVIGIGPAVALGSRFAADARVAFAPLVGAGLLAAASVLLPFGVDAQLLAIAVGVLGVAVGVASWRPVLQALRAAAVPIAIAVAAIVLAGVPGFARGDWHAATLFGSTDSYHWSSQARAYLDSPAAEPVTEHPDRLTYERSRTGHWAAALPFGLLQLAWLSGADPAASYGALAALLAALLPLATFAVARGSLGWGVLPAALAALALAANAALLFATSFSWQQQSAGVAFAFAAAATLRLALEPDGTLKEKLLAGLLTAAALGTYRLGFAPYVAVLLAGVVAAYVADRPRREARRIGRALLPFAAMAVVLSAPSLAALGEGLPDFVSSGGFATAFKRAFPDGQLGEALGLVPNVWALEAGWPPAARIMWLVVAWIAALLLLLAGARALRGSRRADFVAVGGALTVGGYAFFLLPVFASYLSFKVLSYGAPFLVLIALAPFAGRRSVVALAAAALLVPSAVVAAVLAAQRSQTPAAAHLDVERIPAAAVISVEVDDPWEQAWALYYLRRFRLSVERPSYLLTAQGSPRGASAFRHRPVDLVLRERAGRLVLERPAIGAGALRR